MRTQTFIVSMVVAAAALAGSANAAVVDPFTKNQNTYNTFTDITGGLFNQRQLIKSGGGSGSVSSGSVNFVPNSTNMPSFGLGYQQADGSSINLTGIASMSFDIIVGGGAYNLFWIITDANGKANNMEVFGVSTGTLTFSATDTDVGFNWGSVEMMEVVFGQGSSSTDVLSNFNYTVPSPGAAALIGLAGAFGGRRRRN